MATAKQIAWRRKFAQLYGKGKKTIRRGVTMARKRYRGFRRRRGGGLLGGNVMKGALFSIAGGIAGRMLNINPLLTSAAGGYFGGNIKGAVIGAGLELLGVGSMVSGAVSKVIPTAKVGLKGRAAPTNVKWYG